MDKSEWLGDKPDLPPLFGDEPYKENVCPGYLMDQPLVNESIEAWRAFDTGNWEAGHGDAPNILWEGVSWFALVVERFKNWRDRDRAERAKLDKK